MESNVIETLAVGTMIGEYEVTGVLGKGGFGVVYAAIQPEIGKRVAIKVLREDAAKVDEIAQRFKNEARAVNEINHPNIIDIFSFGTLTDSGTPYFVMEHLDGDSLQGRVGVGKLMAPADVAALMAPVASAVDAAHAKGIVHRDLKPDNIFLADNTGTTVVKVLDFGVAKFETMTTQLTGRGQTLGTWLYMAPEQCAGDEVDLSADVYSFGVIMFHALTGRFPIEGKHPMELLTKHLKHARSKPSDYGAPAELDDALMRCLESEPTDRYPSLTSAHAAFAEAVAQLGGQASIAVSAPNSSTSSAAALAPTQASEQRGESARTVVDATGRTEAAPAQIATAAGDHTEPGSKRGVVFAMAGVAVVGLAIAGWLLLRGGDNKPEQTRRSEPVTPAAQPPPPSAQPSTATTPTAIADAAPARVAKTPADATQPNTAEPPPQPTTAKASPQPTATFKPRPKPVAKPRPKLERLTWENYSFQLQYSRLSAAIRNCGNHNPTAKGKLKFWISIAPSGRIGVFDVITAPAGSIAVCAERAARRIRFPRSRKGMTRFSPTMTF